MVNPKGVSASNRGKSAESKVATVLQKLSINLGVVYYRLPDARAGSLQATLADFLAIFFGVPALIEIKEVNHDYRLSYNNFNSSQVARQRLWKLAGAESFVLVHHSPSDTWRCLDIDCFLDRSVGSSWDFRNQPAGKLQEVLLCHLKQRFPNQGSILDRGLLSVK